MEYYYVTCCSNYRQHISMDSSFFPIFVDLLLDINRVRRKLKKTACSLGKLLLKFTSPEISISILSYPKIKCVTAVFNNMRTLKFKPPSKDAFFAAVDQISGGFRLLSTAGKARGFSNKHGSQIWIFFAVESSVFACDSSSLSRGDSSLVEIRKRC